MDNFHNVKNHVSTISIIYVLKYENKKLLKRQILRKMQKFLPYFYELRFRSEHNCRYSLKLILYTIANFEVNKLSPKNGPIYSICFKQQFKGALVFEFFCKILNYFNFCDFIVLIFDFMHPKKSPWLERRRNRERYSCDMKIIYIF